MCCYSIGMSKFRTFINSVIKSCTSPQYYRDILKAKPSFSWQYFLLLQLIISAIVTVALMVPLSMFDAQDAIHRIAEKYPQELEVSLDKTGLKINQPLPYSVPFGFSYSSEEVQTPKNIVTFVDEAEITGLQDIYTYDSLVVLSQTSAYMVKDMDTREVRAYPLNSIELEQPVQITVNEVKALETKLANWPAIKYRLYVGVIGSVFFPAVFVGLLMVRLITLAVYSVAVWIVTKLFFSAKALTYGNAFRIGMHSLTPIVFVSMILSALSIPGFQGFIYFLAYMLWTLVAVNALPNVMVAKTTTKSKSAPKAKRK